MTKNPRKLWEHPHPKCTEMGRFQEKFELAMKRKFKDFHEMHQFSSRHRSLFWLFCWNYFEIIHEGSFRYVVDESARMDSVPAWFPEVKLNFAENVLFSAGLNRMQGKEDHKIAVTEIREGGAASAVNYTWQQLRTKTGALIKALKTNGVVKGDRIAICAANNMDSLTILLACTALGAIFSSSSTDMGVQGILDRLLQIKPRWLFMDDSAVYNGKKIDLIPKMAKILQGMQSITEFQGAISQPRDPAEPSDISHVPNARTLSHFMNESETVKEADGLEFERVGFSEPFLVVYSSGTTGQPKCIVHSVGGVLLNAFKEGFLHNELDKNSVVLQYTTTGWIMYLLMVQSLIFGSRLVLYDGSPFVPDIKALIHLTAQERVTHLGISPRCLEELQRARTYPREIADMKSLQVVTSTGMVLRDELFEWFYDKGFPSHVRLNNMSGGTDIAGCFGIGNPLVPVYVGGCGGCSLGIPVEIYESTNEYGTRIRGIPVKEGVSGELVATESFPNMPTHFWGDPSGSAYRRAYFEKFDNVWNHGDFVFVCPITKQLIFKGRADGVLNPSGVRFGSAEIYRVIESHFSKEIVDSICVGQRRKSDTNERVMLFVLMKPQVKFTKKLVNRIKRAIRRALSARHVPMFIFETPDIPVTVNLKKVELPVKQIVSGNQIVASGTLLNPSSLDFYYQFAEVEKNRQSRL